MAFKFLGASVEQTPPQGDWADQKAQELCSDGYNNINQQIAQALREAYEKGRVDCQTEILTNLSKMKEHMP